MSIMNSIRHPNVLNFMGMCMAPPCLVTEYCVHGSLYDILKEARVDPRGPRARLLDWPRRLGMLLDAALGLLAMHTHKPRPIIHRDLKSPK